MTLDSALAVLLAVPPEKLATDPLLAERAKAARELADALKRQPPDADECARLGDRFLQVCGAHPGTGRPS